MPGERRGQVTRVEVGQLATGGTHHIDGRRQPSSGGTSRISREAYVRICEGLGVRFPGPTRQERAPRDLVCLPRFVRIGGGFLQRRRGSWQIPRI